MRLVDLRVRFGCDDCRDLLVEVPQACREAPLAEKRDAGDESVMKRGEKPAGRDTFAGDPL